MSMKKSNDTIGNQTCDIPTCSAVPQPTAPPRALIQLIKSPFQKGTFNIYLSLAIIFAGSNTIDPLLYNVMFKGYYKINSLFDSHIL